MTRMPISTDPSQDPAVVFAGVDTHKELHVAAVIDTSETVLGTKSFSTTRAGYRATSHGSASKAQAASEPV